MTYDKVSSKTENLKKMWHKISYVLERLQYLTRYRSRYSKFNNIKSNVNNNRVFVIGNGPSLNDIDHTLLQKEDYFLCNLAEKIQWTKGHRHPYYIATDLNVLNKYINNRPGIDSEVYFLSKAISDSLCPSFRNDNNIVHFSSAKGGVLQRGYSPEPWVSIAGGQTVLITATQIALFLGYKEIYILGCDLSYSSPSPYAYEVTNESEEKRVTNDKKMIAKTNEAFSLLNKSAQKMGTTIYNASPEGNLHSLPKVRFDDLFK